MRLRLRSARSVLFAALLAACASARGGAVETGVQIRVRNDLTPSMNVSILAVVDGGTPMRLGSLVAGAEQTFVFRPIVGGGTYRLVADRPGPGGTMFSEPIPFGDMTELVEWQLSTNNIVIR